MTATSLEILDSAEIIPDKKTNSLRMAGGTNEVHLQGYLIENPMLTTNKQWLTMKLKVATPSSSGIQSGITTVRLRVAAKESAKYQHLSANSHVSVKGHVQMTLSPIKGNENQTLKHWNTIVYVEELKEIVDPWLTLPEQFPVGTIVKSNVTSTTDFGVFMEVVDDVDGLVHISELDKVRVENIAEQFPIGAPIEAMVIKMDTEKRQVSLSRRKVLEAQASQTKSQAPAQPQATASQFEQQRIVFETPAQPKPQPSTQQRPPAPQPEYMRSVVETPAQPKPQPSTQQRPPAPQPEYMRSVVETPAQPKPQPSTQQRPPAPQPPQPQPSLSERFPIGTRLDGKVISVMKDGVILEVARGIKSFVHVAELDTAPLENVAEHFPVGTLIQTVVTDIDPKADHLSLSRRKLLESQVPKPKKEPHKKAASVEETPPRAPSESKPREYRVVSQIDFKNDKADNTPGWFASIRDFFSKK